MGPQKAPVGRLAFNVARLYGRVTKPRAPVRIATPVPFPLKTANSWLFPGAEPLLVDCGIGTSLAYQTLLDGVRATATDLTRLRLVITHGHVDHAGNAGRLKRDHGIPLVAHPGEAPFVETFRQNSEPRNDDYHAALLSNGLPAATAKAMRADSDAIDAFLDDTPIDETVLDGDTIQAGDGELAVEHVPGHTPGSVLLHVDDNVVVTGDTLLESITSNAIELRHEEHGSFHRYLQRVEDMRRYVDCQALPGHHSPFTITDDVLDRQLDRHRSRRATILDALDRPRTAWDLMGIVFPNLNEEAQWFMAMSELVGHLHALEIDGFARRVPGAGELHRYQRA